MTSTLAAIGPGDFTGLCLARLRDCLEPASRLFARQIRARAWAPTLGTEGITSTAICLIGLSRAGLEQRELVADEEETCRRMADEIRAQRYPGALGLALWANAVVHGVTPVALLDRAGLDALDLANVVPMLTTMEVAWLVSGLLHSDTPALRIARNAALRELHARYVPGSSLFRHASAAAPLAHRLRGRIANFADQIYPVQAMAFAAMTGAGSGARAVAEDCALRLMRFQGVLGQWWWHYDALAGRVAEGYPVYSVHQHGMAPMALRCLARAGGPAFDDAIARSRAWLRDNELAIDLVDRETGVIWRSIERDESAAMRNLRQARMLLGLPPLKRGKPRFRLNPEIRPYEWGWLLYATALEEGQSGGRHIA